MTCSAFGIVSRASVTGITGITWRNLALLFVAALSALLLAASVKAEPAGLAVVLNETPPIQWVSAILAPWRGAPIGSKRRPDSRMNS